jgi:hypothetical protein
LLPDAYEGAPEATADELLDLFDEGLAALSPGATQQGGSIEPADDLSVEEGGSITPEVEI